MSGSCFEDAIAGKGPGRNCLHPFITFSTRHISQTAAEWLSSIAKDERAQLTVAVYAEGFWVATPPQDDLFFIWAEEQSLPSSLIPVFEYAKKCGADWIQLDRDGDEYDELPVFEW